MGEVINLAKYKEEIMAQELNVIEDLRQELSDIIAELGGIQQVSEYFLASAEEELGPPFSYPSLCNLDGYDVSYTVTNERTKD